MSAKLPDLLALDFDGVICDGLIEYFDSTRKAYEQIWQPEENCDRLAPAFYRLRPVIETGWEMPILLRALVLGISEAEILEDWQKIALKILQSEDLDKASVVQKLDGVRDSQIKHDLSSWLALHRFYPDMVSYLQQIIATNINLYIVTTKEGRFVSQLLQKQGINLSKEQIIGKECKRPKYETLKILRDRHQVEGKDISISFVEDRLPALKQVAREDDLDFVSLYLADWGYNLESDRNLAETDERIQLLCLAQFPQIFSS